MFTPQQHERLGWIEEQQSRYSLMNTVSKVTVCARVGRKHNCRVEVEFGLQLHLQSPSEV